MASVDKFGAAFAIGFMAVMLGIMGAISSDTVTSDRPGAEQQAAVSPPPMPKPSPEKDAIIGTTTGPGSISGLTKEVCWISDPITGEKVRDGIDNDGDGLIDSEDSDENGSPRDAAKLIAANKIAESILSKITSTW